MGVDHGDFFMGMSVFSGCGKKQGGMTVETTAPAEVLSLENCEIQTLSVSRNPSYMPEIGNITLTRTEDGTRVDLSGAFGEYSAEYGRDAEEAGDLLEQAQTILEAYDVGSWNGFCGSNSGVLDGESFELTVEFTDGTRLLASGTNSFPKNYTKVTSELWELIEPARKQWREDAIRR